MARTLVAVPFLLLGMAVVSCGAGRSLADAFNIETNPYKGEVDPTKVNTSALDGRWTVSVSNVVLDDPQHALGFTAQDFVREVNGQSFWFDAGMLASYSYPFNIELAESHLLRLDARKYKLEARGTVTIPTAAGDRSFWAELEISGEVNRSYTQWWGAGELVCRELGSGGFTGGISLDFVLTKH